MRKKFPRHWLRVRALTIAAACAASACEAGDPAAAENDAAQTLGPRTLGQTQQALTQRHGDEPFNEPPATHQSKPGSSKDNQYTLFEAGPVRPVAVLARGIVAVTNVPDDYVELYRPTRAGAEHCGSVHVGLRPVALAAWGNRLWVANHLSDSVSVVRVDPGTCQAVVERTVQVGDEPRDVVIAKASTGKTYAFVTTAHRGQNVRTANGAYRDPELSTPGIGRADVFVFDVNSDSDTPLEILNLFADTPRALTVGKDRVYAAGFLTGNQTAIVKYQLVLAKGQQSLARLDANADGQIDEELSEEERVIEGGYPAVSGHGRCIGSAPPPPPPGAFPGQNFLLDTCVQTDPADPYRALAIVPQVEGAATPECGCTSAEGEVQVSPPLIVRFFEDPAVCGEDFDASRGGCWLEPPQTSDSPLSSGPAVGQAWNDEIAFALPDRDVFSIDLSQHPPALLAEGDFQSVGTTLFNMVVHPKTGKVYVSNTEARNHVRFEGPGAGEEQGERFANTTLRGHVAESRISLLDPSTMAVKPIHLNEHIDREHCCEAGPNADTERSLAMPVGLAISHKRGVRGRLRSDQDLYIAALGSDKVAVLSTEMLDHATPGSLVQDQDDHIEVPGGPVGLALDERRQRLYVLARFDNELVVVDTRSRQVLQRQAMHTPEPDRVIAGRRFLYDARKTSAHGDTACGSCHVFGDLDALSWDLGAPDERTLLNSGPFMERMETLAAPLTSHFLSVKGPMVTQSLRGLANHGPMHWRGDRTGGTGAPGDVHAQPDTGAFSEQAAFKAFNGAFAGLNGRSEPLSERDLQAFTDFALDLTYPPNPIRNLDDALTPQQEGALDTYFGCEATQASVARGECSDGRSIADETLACLCATTPSFTLGIVPVPEQCPPNPECRLNLSDNFSTCNGCHALDPQANAEFGVDQPGFFGSNGRYSADGVSHIMKVPHFRNMYQRVGMFGTVQTPPFGFGLSDNPDSVFGPRNGGLPAAQNALTGEQLRGFGYTHAGEEDTMFHFMTSIAFTKVPTFGPPFVGNNLGGFETTLPAVAHRSACYEDRLPALNAEFLSLLAPEAELEVLRDHLQRLADPSADPGEQAVAAAAVQAFVEALPPSNPGSVLQRALPGQLSLPLLTCPTLPDVATLQAQGCFDLGFFPPPSCVDFFNAVRSCAQWGSTLEQLLGGGSAVCEPEGLEERREVEEFLFAYDSNLKPIVGQQVTVTRRSEPAQRQRLQLLVSQAEAGHCDLVAHFGSRGAVYEQGEFLLDNGRTSSLARLSRRRRPVTFTAVPPGEGRRSGVDRNLDGRLDRL